MDLYASGAKWIWGQAEVSQENINMYYDFSRAFTVEKDNIKVKLNISVDSNYAVWVNKKFVDCGQYHDYKEIKTYDTIDISDFIITGENELYVMVHYQGVDSFQYIKGSPKLIFNIEMDNTVVVSNNKVLCRKNLHYKQGDMPKTTFQLGFTYEYNAQCDEKNEYKPSVELGITDVTLQSRPIKKLIIKDRVKTKIIAQGVFERKLMPTSNTVAMVMHKDYLSSMHPWDMLDICKNSIKIKPDIMVKSLNEGVYMVFDIGFEETGYFNIKLSANEGAIVDVSYGQHLDDLRVRSEVGGRNFANRYICKDGKQEFTHYFSRLSGRYIQLHISNIDTKALCIGYVGVLPIQYPMDNRGEFKCNNSLHNKIYEVAKRTLDLCMHEHYEDTPWREQAMYAMDSRNQALCGYYCFGEYTFAKSSFSLFLNSTTINGYLQLCAPCEFERTIPYFSYMWIIEVVEYIVFSGDIEYIDVVYGKIKDMVMCYLSQIENNMIQRMDDSWHWHFYEWTDGLDGELSTQDRVKNIGRIDAPQNMFFSIMLQRVQLLARVKKDVKFYNVLNKTVLELKNQVNKTFWNEEKGLYVTYINTQDEKLQNHYSELTQSLAIYSEICPEENKQELRKKLADKDNNMVKVSLSHSIFRYEALLQDTITYGNFVFDEVMEIWGDMLFKGATSFWETKLGSDDFSNAGSLCHGWSAVPIFLYHAYLLGVKPNDIGFAQYAIRPVYLKGTKASGVIPTPHNIPDIYIR